MQMMPGQPVAVRGWPARSDWTATRRAGPATGTAAKAAGVDVAWIEAPLDREFSPVLRHQVDAGLGMADGGG